ncbi:MAG: SDR family oxidoreductase [Alphaproteobacteria bacterium]|nr:SDR family oxidoreductase [Alphaproteobacteria bacterium]
MRLFCFGLGYSALALGAELLEEGWQVGGTCTSEEKRAALAEAGIEAHIFRRERPLPAGALGGTTHLLASIPPDDFGDPVVDMHAADIAALVPQLAWAGYLSTTGVYGDRGGDWVDEASELGPAGLRSTRRVRAEAAWFTLHTESSLPLHIFRLAGIYGPGRSTFDQLRTGAAHRVDKPGQVFSRIHVDDLAAVLRASMARPNPGRVYNVCDDEAAPPAAVTEYAARLLGVVPPPLVPYAEAQLSDMARSFYAENKRVRNERIKAELGVRLRYPTYREGLAAVLAEEPSAGPS